MAVAAKDKAAFRCQACGHLEDSGSAGENDTPAACSVCGEGVKFDARGIKSVNPDNWEVLADLPQKALAAYGLTKDTVRTHKPVKSAAPAREGKAVDRSAEDGPKSKDR